MINNTPQVSVIVSVYNHEAYIEECLRSIVNQTYGFQNIQLIVIDDYSTDKSREVVSRISADYDLIFLRNEVNKGIVKNLNSALVIAKGKYLCITGSDDIWNPEKIQIQVDFMEDNTDVGAVSSNELKIDSNSQPLDTKKQRNYHYGSYQFEDVMLRRFFFSTTLAMIRKSAIDKVGNYDTSLRVEDYYMWLKLTYNKYRIVTLPDILGSYRIHSLNTNAKSEMIFDELSKILALYKDHRLYPKAVKRLAIVYFPKIALCNKRKAIRILPDSISLTKFFLRGLCYLFRPSKKHKTHSLFEASP